jgi:hypothetical protein
MIARLCNLIRMKQPSLEQPGLLFASGTTVPTDGATGYATGCIFQHTDGAAESALYVNEGDGDSCDFNAVIPPGSAELADLADVGATAYTAGKILVADGDSFEEVAVSSHATLAANGALTLATVTKTCAIPLNSLHPAGSSATTKDVLPDSPAGDGASLGLADAAGSPVVGTTTNNGATANATEHLQFDYPIPEDYVVGQDITVRVKGLVSAARNAESLLDVVAKHVKAGALDATDLVSTSPIDMKAVTTETNEDFTVSGSASGDELAPGSVLNIVVSFETDDTGGGSDGYAQINGIDVLVPCYR